MSLPDKARVARIDAADRETKSWQMYRQPGFTQAELQAMHRYCIKYLDLVRGGETPTDNQSTDFKPFQTIFYAEAAA